MRHTLASKLMYAAMAVFPAVMMGFSTGPPINRTGAPADGGVTCAACHKTFAPENSDPRGSVVISASPYVPGVTQTLKITISHPLQKRWGFELIARMAGDATKQAGTFSTNSLVRVRCSTGTDAPCNGALEYAEHNAAVVTAVGAGYTYTVDWTPPATAAGDIVLYAAGNAADGNGANSNDYIYTTSAIVSPATCNLSLFPFAKSAVSAASYQNVVSPGSVVALFGALFQPTGLVRSLYPADVAGGSFPQKLSCVAVEVDGKRAPVLYVSESQINFQMPNTIGPSPSTVKVIVNPDAANAQSTTIVARTATASPGLFTFDGVHVTGQAAKAGAMVTVYATGLGDTNPHVNAGQFATGVSPCISLPSISVGGLTVAPTDIQYAGLVPTMISGLYQINFKIPVGVPAGDQAVLVGLAGQNSQSGASLAVAP